MLSVESGAVLPDVMGIWAIIFADLTGWSRLSSHVSQFHCQMVFRLNTPAQSSVFGDCIEINGGIPIYDSYSMLSLEIRTVKVRQ